MATLNQTDDFAATYGFVNRKFVTPSDSYHYNRYLECLNGTDCPTKHLFS
ncbi:hypothetical protein [Parapedobacter luteus]|nr:hypothetical protein [Parapedobacter luteus]